jgi:hypothetical protein
MLVDLSMPQFRSHLPLELWSEVATARQLPPSQTASLGLEEFESQGYIVTEPGHMTTHRYLQDPSLEVRQQVCPPTGLAPSET